jgi:hypothetical protein
LALSVVVVGGAGRLVYPTKDVQVELITHGTRFTLRGIRVVPLNALLAAHVGNHVVGILVLVGLVEVGTVHVPVNSYREYGIATIGVLMCPHRTLLARSVKFFETCHDVIT